MHSNNQKLIQLKKYIMLTFILSEKLLIFMKNEQLLELIGEKYLRELKCNKPMHIGF